MIVRKLIVGLVLIFGFVAQTSAAELTVEEVIAKHRQASSRLEDLKADARLNLQVLLGVLPYSEKLDGHYYYQKPDKHKLEFPDAPSYLQKAPSMFNWNLPETEKYKVVVVAPKNSDQNPAYQLFYKPKHADSSTQSITCSFDSKTWRLMKQETAYKDGGSVKLHFNYKQDSEIPVLDQVIAAVNIPAYKLTGDAVISFSAQTPNKGLDSSVFN